MKIHIMSIRLEVWMFVQTQYIYPKYPSTDLEGLQQFGYNAKVVNAILVGFSKIVFAKVMHCKTTKEI